MSIPCQVFIKCDSKEIDVGFPLNRLGLAVKRQTNLFQPMSVTHLRRREKSLESFFWDKDEVPFRRPVIDGVEVLFNSLFCLFNRWYSSGPVLQLFRRFLRCLTTPE